MNTQPPLFNPDKPPIPSPAEQVDQSIEPIQIIKDTPGLTLQNIIPEEAALEVLKHYEPRAMHIGRFLASLEEINPQGKRVSRSEIGRQLGVNEAMAEGTFNAMRFMLMIDTRTHLTAFGSLVKARSPYLDNQGLLWFLHYLLASNAQLVLWSNLFNFVFAQKEEVSNQEILEAFRVLQGRWSDQTLSKKLRMEANAILKTYTEALFSPLGLLVKEDKALYSGYWNTAIIPAPVWLACILVYRDRYYPGAVSLEIPLLINAHYSPGRILRQKEIYLRQALDELHNSGLITVETRSGLDQVRFKREVTWFSVISRYLSGAAA
jgi:hypothetical protein